MTTTITPTAIDAFVHIEAVRVVDRHRWELGDLDSLAKSIDDVGLLNPITLTRDSRLVAGQRRLEACRRLKWQSIPVRFVDSLDDVAKLLRAERDENTCRKDMLPSELASLGEALLAIEAERARERMANGGRVAAPGRPAERSGDVSGPLADDMTYGEARDAVGAALGMSGRVYGDLRGAFKLATDLEAPEDERAIAKTALDRMDGGVGIMRAAEDMRRDLRAKREEQVADEAETPPSSPPRRGARVAERYTKLRELADSGHSAAQIADLLGYASAHTVRNTARNIGVTIQADRAMGRPRKIDSNRVMRETVHALEGLAMGVRLVRVEELDETEIQEWTSSLTKSLQAVNQLVKQMKEKVRG